MTEPPAVSVRAEPPSVNAPAPASNVMLLREKAEVAVGVRRVAPPKRSAVSVALAATALPDQLAAVLQLSSVPPPFHVKVAATPEDDPAIAERSKAGRSFWETVPALALRGCFEVIPFQNRRRGLHRLGG